MELDSLPYSQEPPLVPFPNQMNPVHIFNTTSTDLF
jgi:hypothetical protein